MGRGSHPRPADPGDRPDLLLGFFSWTERAERSGFCGQTFILGVILGSKRFVEKLKPLLAGRAALKEIPRRERLATRPILAKLSADVPDKQARNQQIHEAASVVSTPSKKLATS